VGQALASLIPLAVAAAVSTVPIMVTILILLSDQRNRSALPYLVGFVVGTLLLVTLGATAAGLLPHPRPRQPDTIVGVLAMLIGLALVAMGVVTLRRREKEPGAPGPGWTRAVGAFGAGRSLGLGLALNLRPKALLLCAAAGLALDSANVGVDDVLVLVLVYTVVATSTVAVPIVATLVSPRRMEPRLVAARRRLALHGAAVAGTMMVVLGVLVAVAGTTHL
jgi:Sap, sulfolipid-1-addressing protein